jgi:hypothetical protein
MSAVKTISYVTDSNGTKKQVQMSVMDYEKIIEKIECLSDEIEDLQDALELEKSKQEATGFRRWEDFVRELKKENKG